MNPDRFDNPLATRYASAEMSAIWSPQRRHGLWRRLWVALAEAERKLGLPIREEQIAELRAKVDTIDFAAAAAYEKRLRHDVMAHVHAYGDDCPGARGIIHLGATSCFVTDNADVILLREGLRMVRRRLAATLFALADFAAKHRDLPCLAFTHLQPAQPTTIGKRACLWAYDLTLDLAEIEYRLETLKLRGAKGTTGSQASFLQLFDGDHAKCRELERLIAQAFDFPPEAVHAVTGQTYTRKVDSQVVDCLAGVAQSLHKFAVDVRLLASRRELDEPFEAEQIGSSAMAYKRNPMRSERICSLARFAMSLPANTAQTAATQWMERTLDDSANRRLVLPQVFLAIDACLILALNVVRGLTAHPAVIAKNLNEELPFMATESILMAGVAAGGDRQDLHERIRQHSLAAAAEIKEGRPNNLLAKIGADPAFAQVDLAATLDPAKFIGRSPQQVDEFLAEVIAPLRAQHSDVGGMSAELHV